MAELEVTQLKLFVCKRLTSPPKGSALLRLTRPPQLALDKTKISLQIGSYRNKDE